MKHVLSKQEVEQFHEQGFLVLKGFYDLELEIKPILRAIYDIIGLCLRKYNIHLERKQFSLEHFDHGYKQLIRFERRIGGDIYDAVKQISAFQRLCSCTANERVFQQIRNSNLVGIAGGGSGIRIDNPGESQYQAPWHQEFPAQLRSIDGLVFWSPLRALTKALGPVEICPSSHKNGPLKVYTEDENVQQKTGAYALRLHREREIVDQYEKVAPLTQLGDLVILDWFVIHRSGNNTSSESRWTMQLRYFNFEDKMGVETGWKGSFAAGNDYSVLFPELVHKRKSA